jgi:hypothetical protein
MSEAAENSTNNNKRKHAEEEVIAPVAEKKDPPAAAEGGGKEPLTIPQVVEAKGVASKLKKLAKHEKKKTKHEKKKEEAVLEEAEPLPVELTKKELDVCRHRIGKSFNKQLSETKFYCDDDKAKKMKIEDSLTENELTALFVDEGGGELVQPTPENRPKAAVFIINLTGEDFCKIAGLKEKDLEQGELWTKGKGSEKQGKKTKVQILSGVVNWTRRSGIAVVTLEIKPASGSKELVCG